MVEGVEHWALSIYCRLGKFVAAGDWAKGGLLAPDTKWHRDSYKK